MLKLARGKILSRGHAGCFLQRFAQPLADKFKKRGGTVRLCKKLARIDVGQFRPWHSRAVTAGKNHAQPRVFNSSNFPASVRPFKPSGKHHVGQH